MRRYLFVAMCLVAAMVLAPSVAATATLSVAVPNHSFQNPIIPHDGNANDEDFLELHSNPPPANQPPGWTFRFEAAPPAIRQWGVQRPNVSFYGANNPMPAPFDQDQFGFINLSVDGQTVATADSNVLGTLAANQLYRLKVAVGARNNLSWRDVHYSVGLVDESGVELGSFQSITLDPGAPVSNIVDLSYTLDTSTSAADSIGKDYFIRIRTANTGVGGSGVGGAGTFTQANFDNVRLQVTPISPTVAVHVPGTSNLWLAGMPDGTVADRTDLAPDHSPVLVDGIALRPGSILRFAASGAVTHNPMEPLQPPDGDASFLYTKLAEHGKAALTNRMNSLVGLFLDDSQPDMSPAPAGLDFTGDFDFDSLAPELKQPFFIGDGMTAGGDMQNFIVPSGATRLYLGTHDGFAWRNNVGSFDVTVTVVPEPGAILLFICGLAPLARHGSIKKSTFLRSRWLAHPLGDGGKHSLEVSLGEAAGVIDFALQWRVRIRRRVFFHRS